MSRPLAFRNIARYVTDVMDNVPLYEALGFQRVRATPAFAMLRSPEGVALTLHGRPEDAEALPPVGATALGFTIAGEPAEACAFVEKAGWRLVRAPSEEDVALFWIYADLDGNPINLVGERRS